MERLVLYKIFCDLDGVLADFDSGVLKVTGFKPGDIAVKDMWKALARETNFFGTLDWMSDGKVLWDHISKYEPTILTGIPFGSWAPKQKREWCYHHLGAYNVITCWSKEKHLHSGEGCILIDDRIKAKAPWEEKGGIFILHVTAEDSIRQLKELGI